MSARVRYRRWIGLSVAVVMALGLAAQPRDLSKAKPETVGFSSQRLERLHAVLQKYIDDQQLPGMVSEEAALIAVEALPTTAPATDAELIRFYTKGERVLRIEAMAHNVTELDCGRSVERFPRIVGELKGILERFVQALSCIDQCFIADDTLDRLPEPSVVGKARVGGIDFNKPRMRHVAEAILTLSWRAKGFTSSELAHEVARLPNQPPAATARAKPHTISRNSAESRWWNGSAEPDATNPLRPA